MSQSKPPWWDDAFNHILAYLSGTAVTELAHIPAVEMHKALEALTRDKQEWDLAIRAQYISRYWNDIEDLLFQDVPRLLRSLAHASLRVEAVGAQRISSTIDWGRTFQERMRGGGPGRYVTVQPERNYGLPENALLVQWIQRIEQVGKDLALALDNAARMPSSPLALDRLGTRLNLIAEVTQEHLRHVRLKSIDVPHALEAKALVRAYSSRNVIYHKLAALSEALDSSVFRLDLDEARRLFRDLALAPDNLDRLFELYVLVKTIESLPPKCWDSHNVSVIRRLVRPGREAVCTVSNHTTGETVEIFYDSSEISGVCAGGIYASLFQYFDLTVHSRRPDIMIRHARPNQAPHHFILEMKRTKDRDYVIDSSYKVLGYLKDFEAAFSYNTHPIHAILVVEGGIQRQGSPPGPLDIFTVDEIVSGDIPKIIEEWVASA